MGIDAYLEEQREKKKILARLLQEYDDGRREVFYCLAVNMLEVSDLKEALGAADCEGTEMTPAEKAEVMIRQLLCSSGQTQYSAGTETLKRTLLTGKIDNRR